MQLNKNIYRISIFLALNCSIFLVINLNKDISVFNGISALWSWCVWAYVLFQLIVLTRHSSLLSLKTGNRLLLCFNYVLLLIFTFLYVYSYVYKVINIKNYILSLLLLMIVVEQVSYRVVHKSQTIEFSSNYSDISEKEIEDFIYAEMLKNDVEEKGIGKEKKEQLRMFSVNNITILFILIVPILSQGLNEFVGSRSALSFILITMFIFVGINKWKYDKSGNTFIRFIFDMVTSVLAIIFYSFCYSFYDIGMFARIFIFIYLLIPYIISTEKINKSIQSKSTHKNL